MDDEPRKKQYMGEFDLQRCRDIIAYALSAQSAEIERLTGVINLCVRALYQAIKIAPLDRLPNLAGEASQEAQALLDSLLPPDAKEEERGCATCEHNHYTRDNAVACDAEVPTGEDCIDPEYKYWQKKDAKGVER